MSVSRADLVNLYLAYFGRPPDIDGLNFYIANAAATLQSVAAAFSASPESQALYGTTFGAAQVEAIYQNLFNRSAEPAGVTYWTTEVAAGRISPAGAALAILQGAQNDDRLSVSNKVLIADSFLTQLDTPIEIAGYSGTAAAAVARGFLHAVGPTLLSVATASANLSAKVMEATGQVSPTFALTKDASNVITLVHAGSAVSVTLSAGTYTFTSSGGVTGTATAIGTVAGVAVPDGTTLTLSSTVAGSKAFTGAGTTVVIASTAGEDLASALTASGISIIQLSSGKNYTLTPVQAAIARIGETGVQGKLTDTATMTVVGTLAELGAGKATTLKAAGADIVVVRVDTGADISGTTVPDVDSIELADGENYTMTAAQAALVGAAPGTQIVTIKNSTAGGLTLSSTVEAFKLANFANEVTMGAVGQEVTGGTNSDTLTAITGVTSTSDLKGGTNVVVVTNGANISAGTFLATGGSLSYNIDAAATATLNLTQLAAVGSAAGTQNIKLSQAASGLTLNAAVETFTLGNFTNSVVMGATGQVIVGGTGADTVTAITGVTSSSDLKGGANVVVVTDGANISAGTFAATGGSVGYNLNAASTATLNATQAAAISAATGTQSVTLSNAASALTLHAAVESFTLGNFTNTVTLGAAAQSVTGGTGADTVSTGALAASGTLDGGGGSADKLSVGGTLGAATVSNFETLNITATANVSAANTGAALGTATLTMAASTSLSMTVAQNEGLAGSATVAGAGQSVTLTDAGAATAIAGIETYHLATGDGSLDASALTTGITVTATTGVQTVTTGSGNDSISTGEGADTVDAGSGNDTVTGGAGADEITLGDGDDVLVFDSLTGADTIADFVVADDSVQLSKAVFTALGAVGALSAAEFESGDGLMAAATADGRVIYDTTSGGLYYDADGTGGADAVLIATFTGSPALALASFAIIA